VRHDSISRRQDNLSELTRRKQIDNPFLDFIDLNVESWGDDSAFIEAPIEFDDDFLSTVIINDFEFSNVSCVGRLQKSFRTFNAKRNSQSK